MALCITGRVAQCILKCVNSWQHSPSFQGEPNRTEWLRSEVSATIVAAFLYFDVGWLAVFQPLSSLLGSGKCLTEIGARPVAQ